jgi:hypothetical protein
MTPHASASSICMPAFLASACATSFRFSAWSTLNERLHSARLAAGAAADVEHSSRLMRTCIFSAIYSTHAAPEAHARRRRPSSIKSHSWDPEVSADARCSLLAAHRRHVRQVCARSRCRRHWGASACDSALASHWHGHLRQRQVQHLCDLRRDFAGVQVLSVW